MRWLLALLLCSCAPAPRPTMLSDLFEAERWEAAYCAAEDPHDLGMALRYLGNLDAALACLSEGGASEDLGFVLCELGRPREAAAVFGQLLSDDPLTILNLASALDASGENAESLLCLALSKMGPDDEAQSPALEGLALYADDKGDYALAARIRAQAEDPVRRTRWPADSEFR